MDPGADLCLQNRTWILKHWKCGFGDLEFKLPYGSTWRSSEKFWSWFFVFCRAVRAVHLRAVRSPRKISRMSCRRGTVFLSLSPPTYIDTAVILGTCWKKRLFPRTYLPWRQKTLFLLLKKKHFVVGILTLNKSEVKWYLVVFIVCCTTFSTYVSLVLSWAQPDIVL